VRLWAELGCLAIRHEGLSATIHLAYTLNLFPWASTTTLSRTEFTRLFRLRNRELLAADNTLSEVVSFAEPRL